MRRGAAARALAAFRGPCGVARALQEGAARWEGPNLYWLGAEISAPTPNVSLSSPSRIASRPPFPPRALRGAPWAAAPAAEATLDSPWTSGGRAATASDRRSTYGNEGAGWTSPRGPISPPGALAAASPSTVAGPAPSRGFRGPALPAFAACGHLLLPPWQADPERTLSGLLPQSTLPWAQLHRSTSGASGASGAGSARGGSTWGAQGASGGPSTRRTEAASGEAAAGGGEDPLLTGAAATVFLRDPRSGAEVLLMGTSHISQPAAEVRALSLYIH